MKIHNRGIRIPNDLQTSNIHAGHHEKLISTK